MSDGTPDRKETLADVVPLNVAKRFEEKFVPEPNTGCWLWIGSIAGKGYGAFWNGKYEVKAHRFSYELYVGPIPKGSGHHGTCVLHRCDVRCCVNPDHLFLGSNQDNAEDRDKKGRNTKGETHPMSKLTEEQVLEIRADGRTHEAIGADYGISDKTVSSIKRRTRWKHI